MAPQGSTSISIFRYQKPTPPTYQAYEQTKGYGGNKDWATSPLSEARLSGFSSGTPARVFSLLSEDIFFSSTNYQSQPELVLRGLARPSLNWITRCNPLLKQILQVSLIDQLFSLMHPLPQAVVALSKFTILTF